MKNLIKKILKEEIEDDFSWVDDVELESIRDDKHRYDIILNVIDKVKEYKGWTIDIGNYDGVVYWYNQNNHNYVGMATPEWNEVFEIPVEVSDEDDNYPVTTIKTPHFKYVFEVEDWYERSYFYIVESILTSYKNGGFVPSVIDGI
jgi:hypothetical protein